MDEVNTSYYKELLQRIKYIINMKSYCYQMKPEGNINISWEICGYIDAEYAEYNDTRKSVTGYVIITNRVVIACCPRIHNTVTLYVTESEHSSITDLCYKVLYIYVVLSL